MVIRLGKRRKSGHYTGKNWSLHWEKVGKREQKGVKVSITLGKSGQNWALHRSKVVKHALLFTKRKKCNAKVSKTGHYTGQKWTKVVITLGKSG